MRPSPLLLVVIVLVSVLSPVTAGAALPAETARPAGPSVLLTGQPPWVAPEGTAVLSLRVNGANYPEGTSDLLVRVTAHRAVTSRSVFNRVIEGTGLGGTEGQLTVPFDSLEEDGNGGRYFPLGVQPADIPADSARPLPGRSGVYPLLVELRRRGVGTVDSFVTPLTVLAPGVVPLTVSWVWRLDATPARTPAGSLRKTSAKAFAPDGRLGRLLAAAASFSDVPLTIAPTPETLDAWTESEESPAPLREALLQANRQLLGGPYVAPDTPALLASGLDGELDTQFALGAETLERILGKAVPTTTLLAGPLDAATLSRLRQYGVQRLVVDPTELEPVEQRLTPGRPFALSDHPAGTRGRVPPYGAAVTDPTLAALLSGEGPSALVAARFLAALSLVALEAPRQERGVVVVTPAGWDPHARILSAVLAGLQANPALQPATLDGLFGDVSPEGASGKPLTRTLADTERSPDSPDSAARLRDARARLSSFTALVGGGEPVSKTAEHALLTSQAGSLRPDVAESYLGAVERQIREVAGKVRGPDRQRVTLTARRASIPISLLNPNPEPLQVRVRLESAQLRFPEGAERLITLPPQNTTEKFVVEARSSGAFPLIINVTSPDGGLLVSRSEITIRSTVVSGVGAFLTASAGVFLLVWWANHLRRARRKGESPRRRMARRAATARLLSSTGPDDLGPGKGDPAAPVTSKTG